MEQTGQTRRDGKTITNHIRVSARQCIYPPIWVVQGSYRVSTKVYRKYSYVSVMYRLSYTHVVVR